MTKNSPSLVASLLAFAGVLASSSPASSQDMRDTVTLMNGKVVRGRVFSQDGDELVLLQGGKRLRYAHKNVRDIHTVNDDVRAFFEYRKSAKGNQKRSWFLVEWAKSKKLPGLARLQALSLVLNDPKFAKAHKFLGHKKRKKEWLWPVGDRFLTKARFDKHHNQWGRALEITGENFRIKTDAGIERVVDALFDLEKLYLFWDDTFASELRMLASLQPIELRAWGSMSKFPKISALQLPFYDVKNGHAATFYRPDAKRPESLFAVATEALIYATLVEGGPNQTRTHLCAFAEIGLGLWVQSAFGGPPGEAAPLERAKLDPITASVVFRSRPKLSRVIHLNYEKFFELSRRVSIRWGATEAFMHYLLSGKPDPKVKKRFYGYLIRVFREGLGDSSSAFDRAMGGRIEDFEPKFLRWLQVHRN